MPTYEYECSACSHHFDAFQSITAAPLEVCPECGGAVKRVISAGAGILFKGSGFYQTDYRSSEYSKAAAKDQAPKESAKKDEKTALKKEAKKAE